MSCALHWFGEYRRVTAVEVLNASPSGLLDLRVEAIVREIEE
jgi:hypothetical protein